MPLVPPVALLLDLDGTLVDTEPHWIAAETALVERFGRTWSHAEALTLVGRGLRDSAAILQRHGVDLPIDEIVEGLTDEVIVRLADGVPWRPGAVELLRDARENGLGTALVTMSVRKMARAVVDALPFGGFDVIVSGSDVSRPKPDPEAYLRAAALLGVPIGATVAVEDSPPGLASAVASGATTIGVPHLVALPDGPGWTRWESLQDRSVADLREVVDARLSATA